MKIHSSCALRQHLHPIKIPNILKNTSLICFPLGAVVLAWKENKIPRKTYLAYRFNLSTRQIQHVDFCCRCTIWLLGKKYPRFRWYFKNSSRSKTGDGHFSNVEAFGRLSSEAIQHAGQYKLARAKATRQRLPPPPLEIDGVGLKCFTNISLSTQPMQHSIPGSS